MTPSETAVVRQAAALLLDYPGERFYRHLPVVRRALTELPGRRPVRALTEFCDFAQATPELELGDHYVQTFDLKRRRSLHLSYYTDGDTRRRGHSLARIKEVFAGCGWRADSRELPDHLAVLLEFAARGDADWGQRLLTGFRPGLALLRAALDEYGTSYVLVLDAVNATVPPMTASEQALAVRLARNGPPAEDVGLAPFGGATSLGMPTVGPRPVAEETR